jgi:hypothetical protein
LALGADLALAAVEQEFAGEVLPSGGRRIGGEGEKSGEDFRGQLVCRDFAGEEPSAGRLGGEDRRQAKKRLSIKSRRKFWRCPPNPVPQCGATGGEIQQVRSELRLRGKQSAEAISEICRREVGEVFAPRLVDGPEIIAQLRAGDCEQRAEDKQAGEPRFRRHRGQARRPGAAQQAMEDGFGLIVGVVGKKDAAEVMLRDDLPKQRVTQSAEEGRFVSRWIAHGAFDIGAASDGAGKLKFVGQPANKVGIAGRIHAASLMIEMNDVKRNIGPILHEQAEQRDRIRAAGDGDGAGGLRQSGK